MKDVKTDTVRDIQRELERIVESEDKCFEDRIGDYDYLACDDPKEVLKAFAENYTSRKIGFTDNDELNGHGVLAAFRKHLEDNAIASLILEASEVETCDYYIQWNEVYSASIGEMEYQIDFDDLPDLKALLDAATPEERAAAGVDASDYKDGSMLVYGMPCDRIIWKVDPEIILERLNQLEGGPK